MKKPFTPNLRTPADQLSKEELNKLNQKDISGQLYEHFRDTTPDLIWESEQLAKSHGIYLEYDRAKTGAEKDWMYMIRISVAGGGPLTCTQWLLVDDLSEKYSKDSSGHSSIRLTTRQNIQFHWIKKPGVLDIVKSLAESGWNSLNGCGDNTRNVMGCPCSRFSDVFNAHAWARRAGEYFQLPLQPFLKVFAIDPKYLRQPTESFQYGKGLLNRKFKIAFSGVHRDAQTGKIVADNCVELLTNDMAIAPVVENNKVVKFQIYIGGGQGERNGKPTMAALAQPLCQVDEANLLKVLDAVVKVHMEWGDRQNRFWARLKYVVKKIGIDWYRDQVSAIVGFPLERPNPDHDFGARHMHHGWMVQPSNGLLSFGAFVENGRVSDQSPNGKLKSLFRHLMQTYPVEMMITPNQDVLFTNIPVESKAEFEADLAKFGYGQRNGKPYSQLRLLSGACVGRDTCRLTYTDSEKFEPELINELEKMGWGQMAESIGITGCERQCFRPATKTIGLVGSGLDRYQLKLMGNEAARHQGVPVISSDGQQMYLKSVPREQIPVLIDALFKNYQKHSRKDEAMGDFHRRIGMDAIIQYLKDNPATVALMEKTMPTDCVID